MKLFYVDLMRGPKIALLAGPFPSEEVARKYERAAYDAAYNLDPWVAFDAYGVVAMEPAIYSKPGKVNHLIEIDPADLVDVKAQRAA